MIGTIKSLEKIDRTLSSTGHCPKDKGHGLYFNPQMSPYAGNTYELEVNTVGSPYVQIVGVSWNWEYQWINFKCPDNIYTSSNTEYTQNIKILRAFQSGYFTSYAVPLIKLKKDYPKDGWTDTGCSITPWNNLLCIKTELLYILINAYILKHKATQSTVVQLAGILDTGNIEMLLDSDDILNESFKVELLKKYKSSKSLIKTKENENQLQRKDINVSGGDLKEGCSIYGGINKTTITIGHLSYKEITSRE